MPDGYSRIFRIVSVWPFGLLDYGSAPLHCKICHLATLDPGLTTLKSAYENGIFTCQFQREGLATVLTPSQVNVTYDLKEEAYHLLLAYGPVNDDARSIVLLQHDDKTASATGATIQ